MSQQCVTTCGTVAGMKAKRRSRSRKEVSAQEVTASKLHTFCRGKNFWKAKFPGFQKTSHELSNGSSKRWNIFHIDLKTAFFQEQFFGVNGDVVCQLSTNESHPFHISA